MIAFISKLSVTFLFTVLMGAGQAFAQSSTVKVDDKLKAKLQQEIDYIGTLYGTVYAPKSWKEIHLGWNLPAEVASAKAKLAASQNLFEARTAVADLIKSTQDYHVGYSFFSTEKATLPFQIKTVEGKSLIVYIDREKLPKDAFPFSNGDELLTMDHTPVAQIFAELIDSMGPNIPETDQALADIYLTRRSAARNFSVPQGPVALSIKRAKDDSVGTVALAWEYTSEQLSNGGSHNFLKADGNNLFNKKMIVASTRELMKVGNPYGLGERKSFLPDFGKRIWESPKTSTFDAYVYQNEKSELIGVIRIPVYEVENDAYDQAMLDFKKIIKYMEGKTKALVIDQNNNPGGSVFYLYALASVLSDQALKVPTHKISLVPSEAKDCLGTLEGLAPVKTDAEAKTVLGATLQGFPVTYSLAVGVRQFCETALREYHQGQHLSSALHLWGVGEINPNPVHYTKPIVLLTNMLDFSGGDFFPAIMQDNKRVTVVGTRTAGAGGYINEASFPNSFGLENITFTGSIAQRVDNNPIENLGVTPDVILPMTANDLRNNYKDYIAKVKELL